jgi:hypothetical protein
MSEMQDKERKDFPVGNGEKLGISCALGHANMM